MGRLQIDIRRLPALRSIAAEKEALHLALQHLDGRIEGFAAWIDDDGPLGVQPIEQAANGFAESPFDAIAHDSLADRTRDGKADARSIRLRFADTESGEERARVASALVINSSEVFRSQQAYTFRKSRDGRATSRN